MGRHHVFPLFLFVRLCHFRRIWPLPFTTNSPRRHELISFRCLVLPYFASDCFAWTTGWCSALHPGAPPMLRALPRYSELVLVEVALQHGRHGTRVAGARLLLLRLGRTVPSRYRVVSQSIEPGPFSAACCQWCTGWLVLSLCGSKPGAPFTPGNQVDLPGTLVC